MMTNQKPPRQGKVPVWRNEWFPRARGVMDAVLRKVELRATPEGLCCAGGWFERQRRRLRAFESAVEQSLDERMQPLLDAYRTASRPGPAQPVPGTAPRSTTQARALREEEARRAQASALAAALTAMIDEADCTIRHAYQAADVAAARYAKATRFRPLEREIPQFGPPAFDARAFARRLGLNPEQKEEEER